MTLTTLEARIKAEYSLVAGWVALHPYPAVGILFVAGFLLGHFI